MLDYKNILKKINKYYIKNIDIYNKEKLPKEFIIMKLYDLVLNILNQNTFNYQYIFKKEDLYFVSKYKINIFEVIEYII